jgi:hypothetical protein
MSLNLIFSDIYSLSLGAVDNRYLVENSLLDEDVGIVSLGDLKGDDLVELLFLEDYLLVGDKFLGVFLVFDLTPLLFLNDTILFSFDFLED